MYDKGRKQMGVLGKGEWGRRIGWVIGGLSESRSLGNPTRGGEIGTCKGD